jgi:hypothetical protein
LIPLFKDKIVNVVVNYHKNPNEQEKPKQVVLLEKELSACKNITFIIHYGKAQART